MELGIEGRTAAVAAGSAGLGFASAAALAQEGVRVAICGRDAQRCKDAAAAIGPHAIALQADVGGIEGATQFVDAATEALGGALDILVVNAGGPPPGTFESTSVDQYQDALNLNLLSVVAMCKTAIPAMRSRGWGRVVAITSMSVRQPIENLILSNTARAGATGFLKTTALEVAPDGVTVNSVQPGYHATDRVKNFFGDKVERVAASVPARQLGDPAGFGAAVAFLCSEYATFITGAALNIDGGSYQGLQ